MEIKSVPIRRWCLSVLLFCSTSQAGPILNGVEWYQPAQLAGYTWLDYAAICNEDAGDGMCNGSLAGGQDLTGWTWASVEDLNDLFNDFIGDAAMGPGPMYFQEVGSEWAPGFMSVFDYTSSSSGFSTMVSGYTRDTRIGVPFLAYLGQLSDRDRPYHNDFANTGNAINKDWENFDVGSWLYRPTGVPSPHTGALLILGLLLLHRRIRLYSRSKFEQRSKT